MAKEVGAIAPRLLNTYAKDPGLYWLIPFAFAIAVGAVLSLGLSRLGGEQGVPARALVIQSVAQTPPTAAPPASVVPSDPSGPSGPSGPSATAPAAVGSDGAAAGSAARAGAITAGQQTVLPLAGAGGASLSGYRGRSVRGASVNVQSVPADEGFWAGDSDHDRVWVQLTGRPPESPYDVDAGDTVTFTGRMVKNPPGFANHVEVTHAEGSPQLDAQQYHIDVDKQSLHLTAR